MGNFDIRNLGFFGGLCDSRFYFCGLADSLRLGLLHGSALEYLCGRRALLFKLRCCNLFDCGLALLQRIKGVELLVRKAESRLILFELSGKLGRICKLAYRTHVSYKAYFDIFTVKITIKILYVHFKKFFIVVKSRATAKISYAGINLIFCRNLNFINAVLYGIFPIGICNIYGRKAKYIGAPVSTLNDLPFDVKFFSEHRRCLCNVTLGKTGFDESSRNFLALIGDILDRHVPYAVVFIFGVIFKGGRFALCSLTETEIFSAHIRFYVDLILYCMKKVYGGNLFELVRIINDKHKFYVIA